MAALAGRLQSPAALLGSLRWPSPECMCLPSPHDPLLGSPNISCVSTPMPYKNERGTAGLICPEYMQSMMYVRCNYQY